MSAKQKPGLGRGFDSLIPKEIVESEFDRTDQHESIREVSVDKIDPNPEQPRREFSKNDLKELASSIKNHGVLQPLVVTKKDDKFELIAGERRLRASKQAGLKTVPVIVRTYNDQQKLEMALIENVQREDLNPIELATAYVKLHDQFNQDYKEIAERVGKDTSTIRNITRLLGLVKEAKYALIEGKISEGHARAILSLKEEDKQKELLNLVLSNSWSVREAERFARSYKDKKQTKKKAMKKMATTTPETKKLAEKINAEVKLQSKAKGGQVIISYKSEDELKRILKELL